MQVQARSAPLHGPSQIEVRRSRERGVDSALHADLGGADVPRLGGPLHDVVVGQAERVGIRAPLGERAESAAGVADVGEVDVAVDDVGHLVTDAIPTNVIRERAQRLEARPVGLHENERLGLCER